MDFLKFLFVCFIVIGGFFLLDNMAGKSTDQMMEEAYAEGQMDAIKGDTKIKYDSVNKTWYWIKSPWIDGRPAIFNINSLKNK